MLPNPDGTVANLVTDRQVRVVPGALARLRTLGDTFAPEAAHRVLGGDADARAFVARLEELSVLVQPDPELFRGTRIRHADVEINAHCNARCRFCPVAADALPPRLMPLSVYERVVAALDPLHLDWVSLNHYNEPLLAPDFLDRTEVLARAGLRLRLFTNGCRLKADVVARLVRQDVVERIVVNLPSADAGRYRELMGVRMPPALLDDVARAAEAGLPVHVCVNGDGRRTPAEAAELRAYFGAREVPVVVYANLTHDRAGLLEGPLVRAPGRFTGTPAGCRRVYEHLSVNVEGKVFLCCQDYRQEHVLGDLLLDTVEAVLAGERAVRFRRQIFGDLPADRDLICRSCIELNHVRTGDAG